MNLLNKIWYHNHPLFYLLIPLSYLYRFLLLLKKLTYTLKLRKIIHPSVPTIVVGNLTVGGTGKTPLIILLAQFLSQHGYKPGIVSRGYGGKPTILPTHVCPHSNPLEVGDEPVLIARKTSCPIVVDPHRVRAARTLLANYDCNVILSDDGLQHTALGRDIEIIVVDGTRGFGNEWCLPAGPLREPVGKLTTANFVVIREPNIYFSENTIRAWPMQFVPDAPYNLLNPKQKLPIADRARKLHAVAGIGNPSVFFDQLRALGFSIIEHPFPDHHPYVAADLNFGSDTTIIMTEKDAVKCQLFAQENYWCLPVSANCDSMPQLLLGLLNSTRKSP